MQSIPALAYTVGALYQKMPHPVGPFVHCSGGHPSVYLLHWSCISLSVLRQSVNCFDKATQKEPVGPFPRGATYPWDSVCTISLEHTRMYLGMRNISSPAHNSSPQLPTPTLCTVRGARPHERLWRSHKKILEKPEAKKTTNVWRECSPPGGGGKAAKRNTMKNGVK